jgi:hypothetical protein
MRRSFGPENLRNLSNVLMIDPLVAQDVTIFRQL